MVEGGGGGGGPNLFDRRAFYIPLQTAFAQSFYLCTFEELSYFPSSLSPLKLTMVISVFLSWPLLNMIFRFVNHFTLPLFTEWDNVVVKLTKMEVARKATDNSVVHDSSYLFFLSDPKHHV